MWTSNNGHGAALVLALLASCTLEAGDAARRRGGSGNGPTTQQSVRETRGAATQLDGSCVDSCGGKARDGNCWCDLMCVEYEDCCADKAAECSGDEPVPSCAGACGGQATSGLCWCDAACETYGDCCSDVEALCSDEPDCPLVACALACEFGFKPGADGCMLCECAEAPQCYVGGCSNELCSDQTGAVSTCIWQDEYACYAKPGAACGACGANEDCLCKWTMTGEAQACLDDLEEGDDCPLAMCNLECEFGFAEDDNGCMVCACQENPDGQFCGGIAAFPCPDGYSCADDPDDDCNPEAGGADCGGICVADQFCSGWVGMECPPGYTCQPNPDPTCMDCPGTCVQMNCPPVACALACEYGFKIGVDGCQICECAEPPQNPVCPDPNDPAVHYIGDSYENPQLCWAITFGCTEDQTLFTNECGCGCIDQAPTTTGSCAGHCGGAAADSSCYCDAQCVGYGDCCADYQDVCDN